MTPPPPKVAVIFESGTGEECSRLPDIESARAGPLESLVPNIKVPKFDISMSRRPEKVKLIVELIISLCVKS